MFLGVVIVVLTFIIFIHACIDKYKERKYTPVIQINILPNPQQLDEESNHPRLVLNNQAYNDDLLTISGFLILVCTISSILIPYAFVKQFAIVQNHLAYYFNINFHLFETLLMHTRTLMYAILIGFVFPLTLILSSSELRSFFLKFLQSLCYGMCIEPYNLHPPNVLM